MDLLHQLIIGALLVGELPPFHCRSHVNAVVNMVVSSPGWYIRIAIDASRRSNCPRSHHLIHDVGINHVIALRHQEEFPAERCRPEQGCQVFWLATEAGNAGLAAQTLTGVIALVVLLPASLLAW